MGASLSFILVTCQLIDAKPIVYPVDFEWVNDSMFYRFTIHFSRVNTVGEVRKMIAHALHVQPDEVKILKRKTLSLHKEGYLENDNETTRQAGIIVYGPPGLGYPGESEFQVELVGAKEPNVDRRLFGTISKWSLLDNKVDKIKDLYNKLRQNYGSDKIPHIRHEIKSLETEIDHLLHHH